ncbi:hypothetical protein [Streptomyces mexicanus]|uniref:hypothetical protein n=1 Tax=Streptomyces mexicanus TaxID=178566 RepID=UPI00364DFF28
MGTSSLGAAPAATPSTGTAADASPARAPSASVAAPSAPTGTADARGVLASGAEAGRRPGTASLPRESSAPSVLVSMPTDLTARH